ncbi:hypothetical protein OYC64_001367 [Pagothenia borchgrevinki]|uniref:Uncharacterized protein n=1 Tax=Pagothenia borchgrevinki TaxID=8213 RepID=A0ABD2GAQ6_PAGBO
MISETCAGVRGDLRLRSGGFNLKMCGCGTSGKSLFRIGKQSLKGHFKLNHVFINSEVCFDWSENVMTFEEKGKMEERGGGSHVTTGRSSSASQQISKKTP